MKKWIAIILLLITAAGTFIACCQTDDCSADEITNSGSNKPEGTCSPFFACATCPGFVEIAAPVQAPMIPVIRIQVHHEQPVVFSLNSYARSFWQPPRIA